MTLAAPPDAEPILAWARRMRVKGALRFPGSDDEILAIVETALQRARRDHEEYVSERHGRSRTASVLRHYRRLIAAAAVPRAHELLLGRAAAILHPELKPPGPVLDRRANVRLFRELGDGKVLDAAMSFVEGREVWAARDVAAGRSYPLDILRADIDEALLGLTAGQGARRSLKFFSVLELGFAFIKLTDAVPSFTTLKGVRRELESVGEFADLVVNADAVFPIPGSDADFDGTIRDVLAECQAAFAAAKDSGADPLDHSAYGSASFIRAK